MLSSLSPNFTEAGLQAQEDISKMVLLSPSEQWSTEERTSITYTSGRMWMSCYKLWVLTPDTMGPISIWNQLISSQQTC